MNASEINIKSVLYLLLQLCFTLACIVVSTNILSAQVHWSQHGVGVTVVGNTSMYTEGSVELLNNAAVVNDGEIQLQNDWINNSNNNALSTAGNGGVSLIGNAQTLTGTATTTFYDLALEGSGVKVADTAVFVNHTLQLNDLVFSVGNNALQLNHPYDTALQRTSGYIAIGINGSLIRTTASTNSYEFPLGTLAANSLRPLLVQPSSNQASSYAVGYRFSDPTLDGYDVQIRADEFCYINSKFYHTISQVSGNIPSTVSVAFNPAQDASFSKMASWDNVEWQSAGVATSSSAASYHFISVANGFSGASSLPLALSETLTRPTVIDPMQTFCFGNTATLSTNVGYDSYLWSNGATTNPASVSTEGFYSVLVDSAGLCTALSDTVFVDFDTVPPLNASFTYAINGNTIFLASAGNNLQSTQWQVQENGNSTVISNDSIAVYNFNAQDSLSICLVAENECVADTVCQTIALTSVGILESDNYELAVYPNPSAGKFNVQFSAPIHQPIGLAVYSMLGKELINKEIKTENGQATIDLSILSTGQYIIRLNTSDFETRKYIQIQKH